jgi:diaminopimelate decarboxylase
VTFAYRDGVLCAEDVSLEEIARRFGTPCYVYSRAAIARNYACFSDALAGQRSLIAYSVKANSNLAVLALMAQLGAGFDIVSGGELARVLAAGGDPRKVVFSGVGKTESEIELALRAGVLCLNLESVAELERVAAVAARLGLRAPVAFRVNPDVDAKTHPYISTGLKDNKFGIAYAEAERVYRDAARHQSLELVGIGCHIGSQMASAAPFVDAAAHILALAERLERAGIRLSHIDLGGGFGIRYRNESPAPVSEYIDGALGVLAGRKETLIVDPGRAIVGDAGVLLTRIEYLKPGETRNFVVVDAAMNDLIRPALYDAWHEIRPVKEEAESGAAAGVYDVVGPVCESADFLARDRKLAVRPGGLLAVMSAGAYCMVMSSNYKSRPRAAEVMVSGGKAALVRERETVEQLFAAERIFL